MAGKYQAYQDYKESNVGWMGAVPRNWEIVPCRSVVKNLVDKNEGAKDQNYLSLMANVGVILYDDKGDVGNKKPDDLSKCKIVKKGNLVINSMNYAIGSYGMSAYDGVCSPVYIVLDANPELVEQRFALRIFENSTFQKYLATFGNGILEHRAAIGWDDIKGAYIPLPSKKEQEAILNFLDHEAAKIDSLIEKQQQLIALLKEKRQAVISHAVTKGLNSNAPMRDSGVEWLGEVPAHWDVTKIKYIAVLTPKKSEAEQFKNQTCSFVPMEKLKKDTLILDEVRLVGEVFDGYTYFKNEDVLMAKVTPCFENKNMVVARDLENGIGFGSSEIYVLRARLNLLNDFLYYRLQEDVFIDLATAAMSGAGGLKRVPSDFVNNFEAALPPENERTQIVDYIRQFTSKFDVLINKAEDAIKLMRERRTALIAAAVTGKIDVRNWQAPASSNNAKTIRR